MNIGDKLYRYADLGKVFEYTVFGVIDRGAGKKLELKCESCNDHTNCEVLVDKVGSDYRYQEMRNNYEDQYMWHNDGVYRRTRKEALNDMYQRMIENHEKSILKAEKDIDWHRTNIAKLNNALATNEVSEQAQH